MAEGANELLNSYYRQKVAVRKNGKDKNFIFVDGIVQDIVAYISTVDTRFDSRASMYGSFCQQLVSGRADEFRYAVKLLVPDPATWVPTPETPDPLGNYKVRTYSFNYPPRDNLDLFGRPLTNGTPMKRIPKTLGIDETGGALPVPEYAYGYLEAAADDEDWADLVVEGDVVPFLAKQHFQKLLKAAHFALDMEDVCSISKTVTGSYFTLTLYRGGREFRVDLALMVQTKMNFPSWLGWPRAAAWPSPDKISTVLAAGINLRATGNFYWRESFAEARTALIKDIDKDGGQRKKVFCILKQINNDVWSNHNCSAPPILSSLDIKNMWLWAVEYKPETEMWQQDQIAARVLEISFMLLSAIRSGNMTHYFDSRRNLLKDKDPKMLQRTEQILADFISDMEKHLSAK